MAKALTGPAGLKGGLGEAAGGSIFGFDIFLLRSSYVEMSGKTSRGTRAKARNEYATLLKFFV